MPDFAVPVTALYAGLNALIMLALAGVIPPMRFRYRVGLGDGGQETLARAVRAHANCSENVPIALILIGVLELMAAPLWLLHALGIALTLGRIAHPIGLYRSSGASPARFLGTSLSWSAIGVGALGCLYYGILS